VEAVNFVTADVGFRYFSLHISGFCCRGWNLTLDFVNFGGFREFRFLDPPVFIHTRARSTSTRTFIARTQ